MFSIPLFQSLEQSFLLPFSCFPLPFSHHLNRVLAAVSMFSIPLFFHQLNRVFASVFMFSVPLFSSLEQSFVSVVSIFFYYPFSSLEQSFLLLFSVLLFHHLRFAFVDKAKVEIFPLASLLIVFASLTQQRGAGLKSRSLARQQEHQRLDCNAIEAINLKCVLEEKRRRNCELKQNLFCSFRFRDRQ
jgi:hypothetical protein